MVRLNEIHSGTLSQQPSERELAHGRLAREAAVEGIVLLRNEGILPLPMSAPVALFGGGADQTVKGGIGSGDVNNRGRVSMEIGLEEGGTSVTSKEWLWE